MAVTVERLLGMSRSERGDIFRASPAVTAPVGTGERRDDGDA